MSLNILSNTCTHISFEMTVMARKKTLMDEWEIFYRGNILRAEVFLLHGF